MAVRWWLPIVAAAGLSLVVAADEIATSEHVKQGEGEVAAADDAAPLSRTFSGAFVSSLAMIIASELGDKTFFIAAILSMRFDRAVVYAGAMGALAVMHVLSAVLGAASGILPAAVTRVLAVVLFAGFGARLLYDGLHMDDGVSDELAEVEEELQAKGLVSDDYLGVASRADETKGLMSSRERRLSADGLEEDNEDFDLDLEALPDATSPSDTVASAAVSSASSSVLWQAATMTFLAEWGDRSQVTTVVMGSQYHLLGIIVGGLLGHALCTGLACIGGKLLASRISEKKVTLLGGALFLVFALHGAYELL